MWEGPHAKAREQHEEKKQQRWKMLQVDSSPHSPFRYTIQGQEVEESGVKSSLGIRELGAGGLGEGVFSFVFISYYATLVLIVNKLN